MLEVCLLALTWMSDPTGIDHSQPAPTHSIATCSRPIVFVIEARTPCASTATIYSSPRVVQKWLKRWEAATHNETDRSRSEQEEFRRRVHESFNEHTLSAAEQLIGRVEAGSLAKTFRWHVIETLGERVRLEAIPRDEVEQLFFRSLRITLNARSGAPEELVIVGRNQLVQTVWQVERFEIENRIELVHLENGVPPTPNRLVRTADARAE